MRWFRRRATYAKVLATLSMFVALVAAAPAAAQSIGFERTWGKDVGEATSATGYEVCVTPANCQNGLPGSLGGELTNPEGIAVDTAGSVYVADADNDRVQKFDSSGNFLSAWGKDVVAGGATGFEICTVAAICKAGVPGGLGGEFDDPVGVAVDSSGGVYVADAENNRIQKFNGAGSFQRTWGKNVVTGGGTERRPAPLRRPARRAKSGPSAPSSDR